MCHVEVAAGGRGYKASCSVQGGAPVLLELCGSVFRQPVSLDGSLLFFRAPVNPQLLSSVAGESATPSSTGVKPILGPHQTNHGPRLSVFSSLSLACPPSRGAVRGRGADRVLQRSRGPRRRPVVLRGGVLSAPGPRRLEAFGPRRRAAQHLRDGEA